MGRDKKVACGKCLRLMRRDTLKRHMKQHEKEKFEKEVFSSPSIRSSTTSLQEDCKSVTDFTSIFVSSDPHCSRSIQKSVNLSPSRGGLHCVPQVYHTCGTCGT